MHAFVVMLVINHLNIDLLNAQCLIIIVQTTNVDLLNDNSSYNGIDIYY